MNNNENRMLAQRSLSNVHDGKSHCPIPRDTLVKIRVRGNDEVFVGKAYEFNWIAPELLGGLKATPRNYSTQVNEEQAELLQNSAVAEYEVMTLAQFTKVVEFINRPILTS